ncbi:DUF4179 domain-containing protein [Metabacillus indicus]|uniref:DUF4179 domain-containing protein n=1 Tax=Metabacillus indicus TaxID=246786 RepID=UPI0029FF6739|nr:DUF4179 domain-containing protein [Metabacillus indicus]MDX8290974.1 DUF4179 domain-containing protein [Metabacillus indicus]
MNKSWFDSQIDQIAVPEDDIMAAVSRGIHEGKKQKKKKMFASAGVLSGSAAAIILGTGFFFAPVNVVLASVPLIGSLYEPFSSFTIGKELASAGLVKELNEKAESGGISITLTSAYYEGNVVGITFKAEGENLPEKWKEGPNDPASGYSLSLFDGKESSQLAGSHSLVETENGYIGTAEYYLDEKKLPSDFTLPLTFTSIAGEKGDWKFEVPLKRIEPKVLAVNGVSKSGSESVTIQTVAKGKATTVIEYKTILSNEYDQLSFKIKDAGGKEQFPVSSEVIRSEKKAGMIVTDWRVLYTDDLLKNEDVLTVLPVIERDESPTMSKLSPGLVLESSRFGYQLRVEQVKRDGDQLIVDYQLSNASGEEFKNDVLQNFAEGVSIKNKETLMNGKISIAADEKEFRFQSVYAIPSETDLSDLTLSVPFGVLSMNRPSEKMEPIKIELE